MKINFIPLLESDNYDTCKDIAFELLNLFLATTGKKYTFTAQLSLMLSEKT